MAYCRKCGKEITSGDKFCANCGANIEAKASPAKIGTKKENIEQHVAPVKNRSSKLKGGLGILFSLALAAAIFYVMGGFEPISDHFVCLERPGENSCGYCPVNATTNGTAHAGKCRYCPMGYSCSGDVCGDLKCSGGGTTNLADQYCTSGYCLSDGHCCPSSAKYYCNGGCYGSASEASDAGCNSVTSFC
jgi:hypothetical protein